MDNDDLVERLLKLAENSPPISLPDVFDNKDGHCLEVMFENVDYYGGPSHNGVTVLRCQETDKIVGCIIHLAKLIDKGKSDE